MAAATIECCKREFKADRTWLFSSLQQYEYEILFEAFCSNCEKPLMAQCYFINAEKGTTHMNKIPRKFHFQWLMRKQTDIFDNGERDYRFLIFASKATLDMSRDVALKPIRFFKALANPVLIPQAH